MLKNVDLPAPFGPMSARISPRGRSKLTSSTARTPPKALRMPATRSSAGSATAALREDPEEAAGKRQHERDQDRAEDELPVLGVPGRRRVEDRVDRGAEWTSRDRLHAAEEHHDERLHRHRDGERVREDAPLEEDERPAREPAEEAGDDEGEPLVRADAHTDRLRAPRVVAHRPEREAEGRAPDEGQERDPAAAREQGEIIVAERRRE